MAASIDNVRIILENDPLLKGKFALNQFAGRGEVLGALPWDESGNPTAISGLIISGTIPQCAKALGLTVASFQTQASKQRHGRGKDGSKRKWRIIRDEETEAQYG